MTLRFASLLALTLLLTLSITSARAQDDTPSWVTGDADCDSGVDAIDAAIALQSDAGFSFELHCPPAADANNDRTVDSLDALLMLQQTASLYDGLGTPEALLCPAAVGKEHYGEINQPIDLNDDGTTEIATVHLFVESDEAKLGIAVPLKGGGTQQIAEIVVPHAAGGPNGPATRWAATDLTGDGIDDVVLCATTFEGLTSAAAYSLDGGTLTVQVIYQFPDAMITKEGDDWVGSSRASWSSGACVEVTVDRYAWNGTFLERIGRDVIEHFSRADCEDTRPAG